MQTKLSFLAANWGALFLSFLGWLVLQMLLGIAFFYSDPQPLTASLILMGGLALLVIFISLLPPLKSIWGGMNRVAFYKSLRYSLITLLWVFPLLAIYSLLEEKILDHFFPGLSIKQPVTDYIEMLPETFRVWIQLYLTVGILGPLIEEVLTRGFLFNGLKAWNPTFIRPFCRAEIFALVASSLIFVMMHWSTSIGLGNLFLFIKLFILSIVIGFSYIKTSSLYTPIFIHSLFNSINVTMLILLN